MNPRLSRLGLSLAAAALVATTHGSALAAPADRVIDDGMPRTTQPTPPTPRAADSARVGRITAIDPIRTRPQGSGVGALAGGVVGGLIGNKVIGGTAATAIGAVGGAVAGNNLERNHREGVAGYHVHVRLDNGRSRTLDQSQVGGLHVGDRIRIEGTRIRRL